MRLPQAGNRHAYAAMVAISVLIFPGLALAEEIHRWVDENGIVNYGQLAPQGVDAVMVGSSAKTRKSSDAVAEPADQSSGTEEEEEQDNLTPEQQQLLDNLKSAEATRQAALVEARANNCERARQVLTNLTKIGRVRVVAQDGTQTILPEEERQRRINEAQEAIAVNCAG